MLIEITFTNGQVANLEVAADFQLYLQNADANEGRPYFNADSVWNEVWTQTPWVGKAGERLRIKNIEVAA